MNQIAKAELTRKRPSDWLAEDVAAVKASFSSWTANQSTVCDGYLSASLEQISAARTIYVVDIKELVTLLLALFVGSGIVTSYALSTSPPLEALFLFVCSTALIVFVWPVLNAIKQKSHAAYDYYVSAILNAAIVHKALLGDCPHPYMANMLNHAELVHEMTTHLEWKDKVIQEWTYGSENRKKEWKTLIVAFDTLLSAAWYAFWIGLALNIAFAAVHCLTAASVAPVST